MTTGGTSANCATLTATCTAAADGGSGSGDTGNGSPAKWNITGTPDQLPAGVTYIRAEYRYNGTLDALTGTREVITGTTEMPDVNYTQSIVLPAPEWERKTALVEVTNVAPGQKVEIVFEIKVTNNNGAACAGAVFTNSTGTSDATTDVEGTATIFISGSNSTAAAATALFHLPVIKKQDANGISNPTITGTIGSICDASNKDASSSKLKNINISCDPGDYYILDARGILPGNGGGDVQTAYADGTEELDLTIFNAANPQWTVTGDGASADESKTVIGNVVTALNAAMDAGTYPRIDLTLPDVTALVKSGTDGFADTPFNPVGSSLRSISAPKVTKIENSAFQQCTNLTTADLPAATSIGGSAFWKCTNLTTINLPKATSIGAGAFEECSKLTTANLPEAIKISSKAFNGCSKLTTVNLPKATSDIGAEAFKNCPALTTVYFTAAGAFRIVDNGGTSLSNPADAKLFGDGFNGDTKTSDCDLFLNEDKKFGASGNGSPKVDADGKWLGYTWKSITYVSTTD